MHEKLICYQKGLGVLQELGHFLRRWPKGYGYLALQAKRAMCSVLLNIAEGNGKKSSAERRRFFEISRASAYEVMACLDCASVMNLMSSSQSSSLKSKIREVIAILSALP